MFSFTFTLLCELKVASFMACYNMSRMLNVELTSFVFEEAFGFALIAKFIMRCHDVCSVFGTIKFITVSCFNIIHLEERGIPCPGLAFSFICFVVFSISFVLFLLSVVIVRAKCPKTESSTTVMVEI